MPGPALPDKHPGQPAKWWWTLAIIVLGVLLIVIFISAAHRNAPVEETVTLPQKVNQRPTKGTLVETVTPLPVGDRDLESIGDRVAEAAVYLRERQRAPALRALAAAESATHQLREKRTDLDPRILNTTSAELAIIEREIQRGNIDEARSRMVQLARNLDSPTHLP
jgi:hypothetical protein